LVNEAAHFPQQLFLRGIQCRTPRINDNVPTAADFRQPHPQQFPDTPPGPIPLNRFPERSRDRETQPRPFVRSPIKLETES